VTPNPIEILTEFFYDWADANGVKYGGERMFHQPGEKSILIPLANHRTYVQICDHRELEVYVFDSYNVRYETCKAAMVIVDLTDPQCFTHIVDAFVIVLGKYRSGVDERVLG
jgi:hypothetical protein